MNNNRLFQNLKQWSLNVSVGSIIFVSVMLLGGTIITLAAPSSLNDVKSTKSNNKLTAENWDYVVDQVMGQINKLTTLSGTISTNIANITNLSGKLATLSGKVNTLINNTNPTTNFDGKFATLSERVDNLYGRVNNLSEEVKNPKPHFTVGRRQNTAAMTGTINLGEQIYCSITDFGNSTGGHCKVKYKSAWTGAGAGAYEVYSWELVMTKGHGGCDVMCLGMK